MGLRLSRLASNDIANYFKTSHFTVIHSLHLQLVSVGLGLFEMNCIMEVWLRLDMISIYSVAALLLQFKPDHCTLLHAHARPAEKNFSWPAQPGHGPGMPGPAAAYVWVCNLP